jgi:hypothetical protein
MAFEINKITKKDLEISLIRVINISLKHLPDLYNAFSDDTLEDYLQNPGEYNEDIEVLNNEENPNHN